MTLVSPKGPGLIVFEGPNATGKTTLAHSLVKVLQSSRRAEYFAFPGQQPRTLGRHIYDLHQNPDAFGIERLAPTSLQLLHIAAHIDAIESKIFPAIEDGISVVLDRFWWSTWVYGKISGVNDDSLKRMIDLELQHWNGIQPTVVFVIRRQVPFEPYSGPQWESLVENYAQLAEREKEKYPIQFLDNDGSVEAAINELNLHVERLSRRQ